MKRRQFITKDFTGAGGKIRLIALAAFIVSLIAFFMPICFEWNKHTDKLVNYFIGAINCSSKPIFLMVLTGITLLLSIICLLARKLFSAFVIGIMSLIFFIILLILIPDSEPRGGPTLIFIIQIGISPGAFFAPVIAAIGTFFSLAGFIYQRKYDN